MEIKGLSATGIRDFLQCKLKVVFRYDREIPSIKNDHAKLGIAVHEATEQATRRLLSKKSFPDASDYEFIVGAFMNSATKEGLQTMSFYTEGKKMLTEFLDRYDPSEEVLDVEHLFKIESPEGVPIVGAMDKVVKVNSETLAIIDYKSSMTALTVWQLKDDIQLSMYDLAASIIWPEFKNRLLVLDYLRLDKRPSTYRTDEERETFRQFLSSTWSQINTMNEQEVTGTINSLCGWCDYKTHCPAYNSLLNDDLPKLPSLSEMDDESFLEHWVQVGDRKNIFEARQRELKMVANEKAIRGETISAGGKELYSTQAARTTYGVESILEVIPKDDLFEVLSVNKSRLDRYVKDRPDLKEPLDRLAKVNYNAPVYKIRASKEEVDSEFVDENESAA